MTHRPTGPSQSAQMGFRRIQIFSGMVSVAFMVAFIYAVVSAIWRLQHGVDSAPLSLQLAMACLVFALPAIICAGVAIWITRRERL